MTDLHAQLTAAVMARMDVARAAAEGAGGGDWRITEPAPCDCCDRVHSESARVLTADNRYSPHIAANGPDIILRHCQRDLRVLERHHPELFHTRATASRVRPICDYCVADAEDEPAAYPCVEVRDLAAAYGIDLP